MKQLAQYINIRKGKTTIKATDDTIWKIVKDELDRLGHDTSLNHIDVSEVTNTGQLFNFGKTYVDLNPDITRWNVSNVKYMNGMFYTCEAFNQDLSQWDVRNVEDMSDMFSGCKSFNQDISGWDVSSVRDMSFMFDGCGNFNQDISGWDVSSVKDITYMFLDCPIKKEYKPKFKFK